MRTSSAGGQLFLGKIQSLQYGLRFFGLDPQDWQIKENCSGFYTIHHLNDPELTFQGQAYSHGQSWDWQEIKLAAI